MAVDGVVEVGEEEGKGCLCGIVVQSDVDSGVLATLEDRFNGICQLRSRTIITSLVVKAVKSERCLRCQT
jgi:hypothetical protein